MTPLRVLVNATSVRQGGGLTHAREQLGQLLAIDDLDITILGTEELAECMPPGTKVLTRWPRQVVRRVAAEQAILPRMATGYDCVYGIGGFAVLRSTTPQVVTFQNPHLFGAVAREIDRRTMTRGWRARMAIERRLAHASLAKATIPIAISQSLRDTMREDMPERKVVVLSSATPVLNASEDELAAHLPLPVPSPYVLAVANDYPHKDWNGLISCFSGQAATPTLVLVGDSDRLGRLRRQTQRSGGNVVLWGPERDRTRLAALYRGADALIAHSYLESYGLTLSEARQLGVPIVATDIPTHREVCGEATFYDITRARAVLPREIAHVRSKRRVLPTLVPRTWSDNAQELAALLRRAAGRA